MSVSSSAATGLSAARFTTPTNGSGRFAQTDRRPQRAKPLMRKYEVAVLSPNGDIDTQTRLAPATPPFEQAFCAFSRGVLIKTDRGPVAVEDLLPGDLLYTVGSGFTPLLWMGSMMLLPQDTPGATPTRLIRLSADALGIARPMTDLILGPAARIFQHGEAIRQITGKPGAFLPATDMIDGMTAIELTPPSPVQVFHLALDGQHRIMANGVELETMHPGDAYSLGLRGQSLELFLSLFPHVENFEGFGTLLHPRLRMSDLEARGVA